MGVVRCAPCRYYLSSGNVARIKEEFDQKSREYKGEGLTLVEFVFVMIKCLGAFVVNQVDFVVQAVDLFRQVDVNDDGSMTWDEFTRCVAPPCVCSDARTCAGTAVVASIDPGCRCCAQLHRGSGVGAGW